MAGAAVHVLERGVDRRLVHILGPGGAKSQGQAPSSNPITDMLSSPMAKAVLAGIASVPGWVWPNATEWGLLLGILGLFGLRDGRLRRDATTVGENGNELFEIDRNGNGTA